MKHFAFLFVLAALSQGGALERERRGLIETNNNGFFTGQTGGLIVQILNGSENVTIDCEAYNTTVWISSEFLNETGDADIDRLVFIDRNGQELGSACSDVPNQDGYHKILEKFADCSRSVETVGAYIYVNYTLCIVPAAPPGNALISRDKSVTFEFTCMYKRKVLADLAVIHPCINKVTIQREPIAVANFSVLVNRYNDTSCNFLETGAILVPDEVFIGLRIEGGESTTLILQLHRCYATPTNNPQDATSYNLITNGCPDIDPNLMDSTIIYENFASYRAKFGFKSFLWSNMPTANQVIYVHCSVVICESAVPGSTCTANPCPSRGRRSSRLEENTIFFSWGPVEVEANTEGCDKSALGCSHGCAVNHVGKDICICPDGYALLSDWKTCKPILTTHVAQRPRHVYVQYGSIMQLVLLGMIGILGFVSIVLYLRKKAVPPLKIVEF